jgi:hypothetical protein
MCTSMSDALIVPRPLIGAVTVIKVPATAAALLKSADVLTLTERVILGAAGQLTVNGKLPSAYGAVGAFWATA